MLLAGPPAAPLSCSLDLRAASCHEHARIVDSWRHRSTALVRGFPMARSGDLWKGERGLASPGNGSKFTNRRVPCRRPPALWFCAVEDQMGQGFEVGVRTVPRVRVRLPGSPLQQMPLGSRPGLRASRLGRCRLLWVDLTSTWIRARSQYPIGAMAA